MTKVLVTGATGNVGSNVVRMLRRRGAAVRALARDPAAASAALGPDVEVARGDLAEPASVRAALDGVDALFLACGNHPGQVDCEVGAIDAAAAAGVGRLVKLSAYGAGIGSAVPFWDWHARIERHLAASGVPAVVLRPRFYMTNLLAAAETVRTAGAIFAPAGGARIPMIDPRDVAAVAATVLTEDGYDGRRLVLSGPEAITYDDVAARLAEATGRPVAFVPVPDDAARGGLARAGVPAWMADGLVAVFGALRADSEPPTGTVRAVTGRDPRGFAEFARDNAVAFGAVEAA